MMTSVLVLYLFGFLLSDAPHDKGCDQLRNSNGPDLIAYLEKTQSVEPPCVAYAISRLGELRSVEAIPVLIRYLDYRRPATAAEKEGFYMHIPSIPGQFPAASALFQIGDAAIPALVAEIARSDPGTVRHTNATDTMFQICRDRPVEAVTILSEASKKSTNLIASRRLKQAARQAANWCLPEVKRECAKALRSKTHR